MKAARSFSVIALALLLLAGLAVPGSQADEASPEITDPAGDATTGRDDMDIESAWVHAETNTSLTFRIKLMALSVFSPRSDWQALPQILYDYYFTIDGKDYALRVRIPVHGPLAVFAGFSLYTVEYGATSSNLTFTQVDGNVTGQYVATGAYTQIGITKSDIGRPDRGDLVTHMWAAVYFQPRGQDMQQVDTAASYGSPGRDYRIKGEFSHFYDVDLEVGNLTALAAPRTKPARFDLTIRSHCDTEIWLNMTNSTITNVGYIANFTRTDAGGLHLTPNSTLLIAFEVRIPDNATNGTNVPVTIWGVYQTREGNDLTTNDILLTVQVRFTTPKPPVEKETFLDILMKYAPYIGALVAIGAVATAIWVYRDRKRKREEQDDLVAYQAYVAAHKQEREAGRAPPV